MRSPALTLTVLALAVPLAACGSSGSKVTEGPATTTASAGDAAKGTSPVALDPSHTAAAAFTAHAGVAFGTFYRFIYAPYGAGAFNPARPDRAALSRARSAAVLVAREIDAATRATRLSATLARLRAPMATLDEGFKIGLAKLRAGRFNLAEIQAANLAIGAIKGSAASSGLTILESS
jgi:hypothetical protein